MSVHIAFSVYRAAGWWPFVSSGGRRVFVWSWSAVARISGDGWSPFVFKRSHVVMECMAFYDQEI